MGKIDMDTYDWDAMPDFSEDEPAEEPPATKRKPTVDLDNIDWDLIGDFADDQDDEPAEKPQPTRRKPKVIARPARATPPAVDHVTARPTPLEDDAPTAPPPADYVDAVDASATTARPAPLDEDEDELLMRLQIEDASAPPNNVRLMDEVRAKVAEARIIEPVPQWMVGAPINGKTGLIAKTSLGLAWVLEHHPEVGGRLRYNERKQQPSTSRAMPWAPAGPVSDAWETELELWCQQQLGVSYAPQIITRVVVALAQRDSYDPVVEYLEGLAWDDVPRLDRFLIQHAGAPDSITTEAMTAAWMISAVRRALEPGCKADHMMILEGPQGCRKSTLLRALADAAGPGLYSEDLPTDLDNKDAQSYLRGPWLVEIAELGAIARSTIETTKRFLTTTHDRYRPAYGRHEIEVPRRCIFGGTTNERTGYIGDSTGARRFWPIRSSCTKSNPIDVDAVHAKVDQLWAEAMHRARAGEPHWLRGITADYAHALQADRQERSVWHDVLEARVRGLAWVTSDELWQWTGHDTGRRTRAVQRDLHATMHALGWRQHRRNDGRGWVPEGDHGGSK